MRVSLLLFLFLIGYADLAAQDSTLVTIKAGYKIKDVLTPGDIYHYPQFTNGKVFFRDGAKAAARMNFSRLTDQMLFIDPKGDTLELADEITIKFIAIERDTFFYDKGYIRQIADGGVKLAEKQIWVQADVRKIGSHNRQSTTVAVTTVAIYSDGNDVRIRDLILREDIILRKDTHYYIGDKYDKFVRADRKSVLKHFQKRQPEIEKYLKENSIDFDKRDDLIKLTQFLGQFD